MRCLLLISRSDILFKPLSLKFHAITRCFSQIICGQTEPIEFRLRGAIAAQIQTQQGQSVKRMRGKGESMAVKRGDEVACRREAPPTSEGESDCRERATARGRRVDQTMRRSKWDAGRVAGRPASAERPPEMAVPARSRHPPIANDKKKGSSTYTMCEILHLSPHMGPIPETIDFSTRRLKNACFQVMPAAVSSGSLPTSS